MEAVGLAISIVSLAGVFKDCIDLFSMISVANSLGKDFAILSVKLDIEKTLLLQWAEQVRLIYNNYDRRLNNPYTKKTIAGILESIKVLLSDGSKLEQRYGMKPLRIDQRERTAILSDYRLQQFRHDFEELALNDHPSIETVNEPHRIQESSRSKPDVNADTISLKQKPTLKTKFCWAVRDKEKFESLIRDLSELVRGLKAIVPLEQSASVELLQEDVQHVGRISRLELIMDGAKDHNQSDSFTDVIQRQIDQRCQQRILDSLWYRMLEHRRNSVSEAHPGTLDWALHPPADNVKWDNLSQWLQSGSGIYWILGKAGSGKTTLMKHLYDSSVACCLLSKWAKSEQLIIPHFFFWNLGTPEQKTQYGLYRGLLYYIFKDNPSLIPAMLPEMWREAHNDSSPANRTSLETQTSVLDLPTEEEMKLAFRRLKAHCKAAFCFFIDGLDEYSGDPFRLITFLEELISSKIKVVVSSRPIPSCCQAFKRRPQLRLQDLTQNDIKKYVHDIIALHPHTETIIEMDSTIVDKIQDELTHKASGVFLWVVLACRSLIQGFAAYDSPEELQQRLDELPPELNDLFKHILQRFDPRYYEQAAKLLRLCFHSTSLRINPDDPHNGLFTLGLAQADADKLDITKPLQYYHLSQKERVSKCKLLEARLRSRCCGLLEIGFGHTRLCFCKFGDHHSRETPNHQIVDSTVEFIHRTVFEFLKAPEVWDHEHLQILDTRFYPDAILSRVNAHLMLASIHTDGDDSIGCQYNEAFSPMLDVSLHHLKNMDSRLKDGCTVFRGQALLHALREVTEILRLLVSSIEAAGSSTTELLNYLKLHFRVSRNGCPDLVAKLVCELGMDTALHYMDVSRYGDQSSPLLYHAMKRLILQFVSSFAVGADVLPCSRGIVKELVVKGCGVNETFIEYFYGVTTTPWLHWLNQPPPHNYQTALGDTWLAEEFLNARADIAGAVDRFKKPITILIGRRILGDSLAETAINDEDGRFTASHPFFKEDLLNESLRSSYARVRSLLKDGARQGQETVEVNSAPQASPGRGCDKESRFKRRHGEAIKDDEYVHPSGTGGHHPKRRRTSAQLDTEMGTEDLIC